MKASTVITNQNQHTDCVTVRVRYRVIEGMEETFDHWLRQVSWYELSACGNRGVAVERTLYRQGLEYRVTSYFQNRDCLERWLNSEQRNYSFAQLPKITVEPPQIEQVVSATDRKVESRCGRNRQNGHVLRSLMTTLTLLLLLWSLQPLLPLAMVQQMMPSWPLALLQNVWAVYVVLFMLMALAAHFIVLPLIRLLHKGIIRSRWHYRRVRASASREGYAPV